jgi:hypothetical protein
VLGLGYGLVVSVQKFGADLGRRAVIETAVWTDGVVFVPEGADDDLRLQDALEQLSIEAFVPEAAVEAFVEAVLPRTAALDEARNDAALFKPALEHAGDKLAPVVAAQVPGGLPWRRTASSKARTTSGAFIRRLTAMSMQWWLPSSTTVKNLSATPCGRHRARASLRAAALAAPCAGRSPSRGVAPSRVCGGNRSAEAFATAP